MIIIGERINSTRAIIREAIGRKDLSFLLTEAERQLACGARFIDVNCATSMKQEIEDLKWLIIGIQKRFGCSISIDSPNPQAIEAAVKVHKGTPFINSVTAEEERMGRLLSVVKESGCYAIALTMDDKGMPEDTDGRVEMAQKIMDISTKRGIGRDNIYVDPLVKPVSTEPQQAGYYLEAVKRLKSKGVKTIGGLSNVSFGLPKRGLLNAAFLRLAIEAGIDAAIIDPTDSLISLVLNGKDLPKEPFNLARDLLLGKDEYAMNYIKAFRSGALDF